MKKRFVSLVLCFLLASGSTAHALFIPAIVPVIAIGAGALIAAGLNLGVLYGMLTSDGTSHLVNSSGDISRKAEAKYIEIDMNSLPVVRSKPVTAHMPFDKAQQIATKKNLDGSNKYPAAYPKFVGINTLKTSDYVGSSPVKPSLPLNSLLLQNISTLTNYSKYLKVATVPSVHSTSGCTCKQAGINGISVNASYIVLCEDHTNPTSYTTYSYGYSNNQPAPPPSPLPPPVVAANLSGSSSGGAIVDSPLQAELDKMFQDPDYVPAFTDDSTGLPYSPPVGLPSPDQIKAAVDTYNRNGALADSKASVQSANSGAVSAARGAADSAHAAAQQAGSASAANPGDAGLANAYADALARAAAADAALAKAKADQAKSDNAFTNMSASASESMPSVAKPDEIKSVDFSTLARLNGVISNTFPLSMLTNVPSYLAPLLSGDVSAPQFDIPLYGDKKFHIDLTPFDPVAAVMRFIMALLISIGMILYVIRFWRGVS